MSANVLLVRPDNAGDVLLTGPAVRAVAATAAHVTFWCGPNGRRAAEMLHGVDDVLCAALPWIDPGPDGVVWETIASLAREVEAAEADEAYVFTSFHQSPLPTALVVRMAGVQRVAAICEDYPGALLDVRHRVPDGIHEVERALSLVATGGYRLPAGDSGRLGVRGLVDAPGMPQDPFVVVHPGASVPARAWGADRYTGLVDALLSEGWRVAVTGGEDETELTAHVAGGPRPGVTDLGGRTSWRELAGVLSGARGVVVGNTGPAHLAAAVGAPVVSLFAPTVPLERWRPWGVPVEVLGDTGIACGGCRARDCPLPGHPCVEGIAVGEVVDAVRRLLSDRDRSLPWLLGDRA